MSVSIEFILMLGRASLSITKPDRDWFRLENHVLLLTPICTRVGPQSVYVTGTRVADIRVARMDTWFRTERTMAAKGLTKPSCGVRT